MKYSESARPAMAKHNQYHACNGQYVAVLSDQGRKLLMSEALPNNLRIPTVDTGICSAIQSERYRERVGDLLGLSNVDSHVIEEYAFDDEYDLNDNGLAVSLTIIEVLSDITTALFPLVWVHWRQNDTVIHSTSDHPAVSHYLRSFLDALGHQTPRNTHLPWYCFGYFQKLKPLLTERLRTVGYEMVGEPEQVRFSCHSSTYRIPSKPHDLFFKACPVGSNEMLKTQVTCKFFPNDFVSLVCLVPEFNGIVTLDAGPCLNSLTSEPIGSERSQEYSGENRVLECAMKYWADFQQRSSACVPQLKASGLQVCDKAWVVEGAKELRTFCRDHELLPQAQITRLEECDTMIEDAFAMWKVSGVPETVVHGDLCESNIAQPGGPGTPFIAFDLCTVFIGCPFFDLRDPASSSMQTRQAAYLRCWEHFCDAHRINALAELMKPMQYLIEAIMVMRDKALWTEWVKSDVISNVESLLEEVDNLISMGSGAVTS